MALVFVHGVNVRYQPGKDPFVAARDALFRRSALSHLVKDPAPSLIVNPYWGDAAATFPWNHGGLPEGRYEQFGTDDIAAGSLLNDLTHVMKLNYSAAAANGLRDPDQILLTLARDSLEAAIDALWVAASENLRVDLAPALAELSMAVAKYAASDPEPDWLKDVRNDQDLISILFRHALPEATAAQETFGFDDVKDAIRGAAEKLRDVVVQLFDSAKKAMEGVKGEARHRVDEILLRVRTPIHRTLTTFLGDTFVYFHQREIGKEPSGRKRISDIVSAAFDEAEQNRNRTGEPVLVVAHSMGGNIVYDLLTSSRKDFHVDVFVTVGSQVAVMEEMKLFTSSDPSVPNKTTKKVSAPANVKRWINVFDSTDILGFAAARVFEGVEDYHFATGHAWAHSGYFVEPLFHERLGRRLKGAI